MRPRPHGAERVLELAIRTIEDKGEAGLRVQELCDDVGVAVTVLYRAYGSREGLIEAAQAERYVRNLLADAERFSTDVDACESADDARDLIERTMERFFSDRNAVLRIRRTNALGSAHSRPNLAAALGTAQSRFNEAFGSAVRRLQERGWVRADLDATTMSAWLAGVVLSRVVIEVGPTNADPTAWNRMASEAILTVMFGDAQISDPGPTRS